jgi:hypothetical protein
VCDKRKQQFGLRNEADDAHPLKPESERDRLACPLEDRPRPILTRGKHTSETMKSSELDMRLSGNDPNLTPIYNGPQPALQLITAPPLSI